VKARKGGSYIPKEDMERHRTDTPGDERWLYIWGRVNYKDGFGGKRFTGFCHRYNLGGMKDDCSLSGKISRYHESGNYTDEESERRAD
jgi:hypothetical protein